MKRIAAILLAAVVAGAGCSDDGVAPTAYTGPSRVVIMGNLTRMDTGEESRVQVLMEYEVRASFSGNDYLNVITEPVRLSVRGQDPILVEGASVLDSTTLLLSLRERPNRTTEVRGNLSGHDGYAIRWMARCPQRQRGWSKFRLGDVFTSDSQVQIIIRDQTQNYYLFSGTDLAISVTGIDRTLGASLALQK